MQHFRENPKIAHLIFILEMRTFHFRFETFNFHVHEHLIVHLVFTELSRPRARGSLGPVGPEAGAGTRLAGMRQASQGSFERLYRNEILQVNMRLKALAEIYTMHSFAQLCNLNSLSEIANLFLLNIANSANLLI